LGVLAALVALAGPAHARSLTVAGHGADADGCGTAALPCRSISQAIRLAAAGDTIVVGPGRYGDLSDNATFGEPGDETAPAACGCLILVDKRVTIVSRDGAYATVIDANGAPRDLVRIAASGAVFGRARQGFTLMNAAGAGLVVAGDAKIQGVRVEGNLVVRNGAIANGQGISTRAERTTFQNNAVAGSDGPGFFVASVPVISANDILGNLGPAITTGMTTTATGNNIVGNSRAWVEGVAFGGACGVFVDEGETLLANPYRYNEGPRDLLP
jgi:hypothetical protein